MPRKRAPKRAPRKPQTDPSRAQHFIGVWREHMGFSTEALCEVAGISQSQVSRLETGRSAYSWKSIQAIAVAYKITPAELIGRDPKDPNDIWALSKMLRALPPDTRETLAAVIREFYIKSANADATMTDPAAAARIAARR